MRSVLTVASVMMASLVMVLGTFALNAAAKTVIVTDGSDAGPGTFRAAIEQANVDPKIGKIMIAKDVGTIELSDTVTYTGMQDMSIVGKGTVIQPVAGSEGVFDLFASTSGADLSLTKLTIQDGAKGVFIPVPADADWDISVYVKEVEVQYNTLFGLHIDDQTNNSDASIRLAVLHSTFTGNGTGDLDFDGIRVDEGGTGSIDARVIGCHIDENGGDGLELDERGSGSVGLEAVGSTFDGNGFFDPEDLDDGIDIDEADDGGLRVRMVGCTVNGNFDQGLDLDEEQGGDVEISLVKVRANGNVREGIKVDEKLLEDENGDPIPGTSAGDLTVSLVLVDASGNAGEEGIALTEEGDGNFFASIRNVTAGWNGKEGIDLSEGGIGDLMAQLRDVLADGNDDDGIQVEEEKEGDLWVSAVNVASTNNTKFGMKVAQETVDDDEGFLCLKNVTLEPNGDGDLDTEGVILCDD